MSSDTSHPHASRRTPKDAPGTIRVPPGAPKPVIRVMAFGPRGHEEAAIQDPQAIRKYLDAWPVTWVNVDGLGDAEVLAGLGELFGLHPLALEDVAHVHQRAKVEPYEDSLFIVVRMPSAGDRVQTEQVCLFLGRNYVLTFQERPGDCLDPVRTRIVQGTGRVRKSGPDYLAYALIDAIIDGYYPLLERYGERLEELEERVIAAPDARAVAQVHAARRDLLALRRATWPLREAMNALTRDEHPLIARATRPYFRDSYDHAVQILDIVETHRELASGLLEAYQSGVSNRMNEVMKVLTVIATVFIPLGFLAGVWGMNFNTQVSPYNMPMLNWRYGYPFALGIMLAVAAVMVCFFRRRGWLGGGAPGR